jgi:hypothetical protein
MSRVNIGSAEFFEISRKFFQPRFDAAKAKGELRDGVEFLEFMDWIIHVVVAYVLAPSPFADASRRRYMLWRFLVPSIVREQAIPFDHR